MFCVTDDPPQDGAAAEKAAHPILLYDGICGLCNRMVHFVLRRDPAAVFRFAALQSELATRILTRHGADARDLDTVYVVVNYELADEQLLSRSDAVSLIFQHLGAAEFRSARPGPRAGTHPNNTNTRVFILAADRACPTDGSQLASRLGIQTGGAPPLPHLRAV